MANVVVTLRIMPTSPEVDLKKLETEVKAKIHAFCGEEQFKVEIIPIAFGLKAMQIMFVMNEKRGDTEPLEKAIGQVTGVNSVEVTDVRRTIG